MKWIICMLAALAVGCSMRVESNDQPTQVGFTAGTFGNDVRSAGPDEFGVVCYWRYADNLSCVKVR